jgi:hypothetical protein
MWVLEKCHLFDVQTAVGIPPPTAVTQSARVSLLHVAIKHEIILSNTFYKFVFCVTG